MSDPDPEIAKTQEERKRMEQRKSMEQQLASMNSVTCDAEFYGGTDKADYVSSIPVENDVVRRMASYTAPKSLIHDMPRGGEEDEASGMPRSKKIIDREDDYRRRRLNRIISPERHDPSAAGEKTPDPSVRTYAEIMREEALKREKAERHDPQTTHKEMPMSVEAPLTSGAADSHTNRPLANLEIPNPKPGSGEMEVDELDAEYESDDEVVLPCDVCLKEDPDHLPNRCPYLERVPNPKDTPVGSQYMIVCVHCFSEDHGHPDGEWAGRAILNPKFLFEEPARHDPTLSHDSIRHAWAEVGALLMRK